LLFPYAPLHLCGKLILNPKEVSREGRQGKKRTIKADLIKPISAWA
jgi:hypothetical protein